VDIQAPKIHSYCNGHAIFQTPSQSLHGDTLALTGQGGRLNVGVGTTTPRYSRITRSCQEISNNICPRRSLRSFRMSCLKRSRPFACPSPGKVALQIQ
jgi:hypothetical protein